MTSNNKPTTPSDSSTTRPLGSLTDAALISLWKARPEDVADEMVHRRVTTDLTPSQAWATMSAIQRELRQAQTEPEAEPESDA